MNLAKEERSISEFVNICSDILCDELFKTEKNYRHHGDINTHYHSIYVSYTVLKLCNALNVSDKESIVRAALLHDFYLYEWYTEKHGENHIWYHPKESVKNIEEHFGNLNDMQRNMILSHMFPTCVELPRYKGSWILTMSDKKCATEDYFKLSARFADIYDEINRRCSNA